MEKINEAQLAEGRPAVFLTGLEEAPRAMELAGVVYEEAVSLTDMSFCKAEIQQECMAGSLCIPKLLDVLGKRCRVLLFINQRNLVIVDSDDFSLRMVRHILRRRLDRAFHVLGNATEERYAQLTPDWRGVCPLRGKDGFCTLQQECGEDVLPLVCRYYPRGLRTAFAQTCCCANSCEAVLEQMFQKEAPLTFLYAAARLEAAFPKWPVYFEHMMVNHVFFDGYPYADRHESLVDEYVALCAVYAVLRFTAIGWMAEHTGMDALVDVCAATFRLIEHSSFIWNAPLVLQKAGVKTVRDVDSMVQA